MRFPPFTSRTTGTVVPVSALRTEKSVGVGEFADLKELADLCGKTGLRVVQLLPVNDSGFQSSPYSALSAFALHPLYLRIGDLNEAASFKPELAAMKERFEGAERFDFNGVLGAKMALLGKIYAANAERIAERAEPGKPLGEWMTANSWVAEYAVYRRLKEFYGGAHWESWPEYARPSAQEIEALWKDPKLRADHLFWVWLQAELDAQFADAAKYLYDRGVALEGDLPILMNEDSCDVWAHPEFFRSDLSAGAPPDMFSPLGQNWQFPIYDWDAQERDGYSWWKLRLAVADRYYAAYRIDHVLGFFRIWAASRRDRSAVLARFVPSLHIDRKELEELGFDAARIRWMSRPHVPGSLVRDALSGAANAEKEADRVFARAFDRIGNEDLWLFKASVRGEIDIEELDIHRDAVGTLQSAWRDRMLLEFENDRFAPTWNYWDTRAYPTLGEDERRRFEELVSRKRSESEKIWEVQGRKLLGVLIESSPMLPCAEDLGVVPDCVPRVLGALGVLGLRVLRWTRDWGERGEPYIPLDKYPYLSVCTPAVHDSSTVREWWEREADRDLLRAFIGQPKLSDRYSPEVARALLGAAARAESVLCVFQLQDLLHLREAYYAADPTRERVNVPGTVNDFNWTYRLPAPLSAISADGKLLGEIEKIVNERAKRPLPPGERTT